MKFLIASLSLIFFGFNAYSFQYLKTDNSNVSSEILADNLQYPWSMLELDDGSLLITEKAGSIRHFYPGRDDVIKLSGLPKVYFSGQAGLFAIVKDPKFDQNSTIYLSYTIKDDKNIVLKVASAKFNNDQLSNLKEIFSVAAAGGGNFGGMLLFLPDGTLLVSVGDRFEADKAQDLKSPLGKIFRINSDGSIPTNNPNLGGVKGIYSYGNRNPQGLVFDEKKNLVWESEHGPAGGDEVNILASGKNYGWAKVSYGRNYNGTIVGNGAVSEKGIADPIYYWNPSIAPGNIAVYNNDLFKDWQGNLLVASLKFAYLSRLELDNNNKVVKEEKLFQNQWGRIRDVYVAKSGLIYLLTDQNPGYLIAISPASK